MLLKSFDPFRRSATTNTETRFIYIIDYYANGNNILKKRITTNLKKKPSSIWIKRNYG